MKKVIKIALVSVCLIAVLSAAACAKGDDVLMQSVSEYRNSVLVGKNERFSAEIISGYRENPFEIDGKSGEKSDYTLITITPSRAMSDKTLSVSLSADGKKTEGNAVRHPYKDSYSFEFMSKTECQSAVLTVSDGNSDCEIELSCVRKEGEISGYDAMKATLNELSESLAPYMSDGKFNGEIFIRYVSNPIGDDGKYYWYVSFVPEVAPDKTIASLVDVVSGRITASRK